MLLLPVPIPDLVRHPLVAAGFVETFVGAIRLRKVTLSITLCELGPY